jgi:hypothetical protein
MTTVLCCVLVVSCTWSTVQQYLGCTCPDRELVMLPRGLVEEITRTKQTVWEMVQSFSCTALSKPVKKFASKAPDRLRRGNTTTFSSHQTKCLASRVRTRVPLHCYALLSYHILDRPQWTPKSSIQIARLARATATVFE